MTDKTDLPLVKALIFDMDGLMIDSERLYFQAEREIAGRFGKEVKEEILWKMMGRKPAESIRIFIDGLGIPLEPEAALGMRDELMRRLLQTDLVPMPGLEDILRVFHPRIKLAVATGAPREFLDIVVDSLNIRGKFEVLTSSDEIGRGKPDPEIYIKTCRRLGVGTAQCVVLEDSANGVLAGKAAGCYVIAVPSEYTRGQDFGTADFVASNLLTAGDQIDKLLERTR